MFAAAIGAAALGKFEEGAFLLVLFALGGAGEEIAMDRARRAIEALAKLAPETATVRDRESGKDQLVRVADVKVHDLVVVRPFDRLPCDGVVESGASAIDQSPITGESIPVEKTAGSPVFAGTINGEGLLLVSVTKLSTESTLAKVVRMVEEAQTTKSPTQVFTGPGRALVRAVRADRDIGADRRAPAVPGRPGRCGSTARWHSSRRRHPARWRSAPRPRCSAGSRGPRESACW
jgi:cation transport ATPase